MLLNSATQYAITIITEMRGKQEPVRAYEIVKKHDLSPSFVDQICRKLRDAGIIKSLRGPGGGYILAKEQVTVLELMDLLSVTQTRDVKPSAQHIINSVNQVLATIHV